MAFRRTGLLIEADDIARDYTGPYGKIWVKIRRARFSGTANDSHRHPKVFS